MAAKNVKAPRLPNAPQEYDPRFIEELLRILNLYFAQLDNPGPLAAATQRGGGKIVSALSFTEPGASSGTVVSLPTQADLASLRSGDIYYDTTAGNVLKIKP